MEIHRLTEIIELEVTANTYTCPPFAIPIDMLELIISYIASLVNFVFVEIEPTIQ